MNPESNPPSPSSPTASDLADLAGDRDSILQRILRGAEPIGRAGDGREAYQLPNGARLILSPHRQAKKIVRSTEQLSSRQFRKLRKKLGREAKERANDAAKTETSASVGIG